MKSLYRSLATIGLIGSIITGTMISQVPSAKALPEKDVIEALKPVPVFAITNAKGELIVATVPAGQNKTKEITSIFFSRQDAQSFVEALRKKQPEIAKTLQITPISLGQIYQIAKQNATKPNGIGFELIPMAQQLQQANTVLSQNGKKEQFDGVPLFIARGGKDNGYLTLQRDKQQIVPFFFDKTELQAMLENFKKQQPNIANSVKIEVVPLEGVISTLETNNDPQIKQILLVPSSKILESLRTSAPPNPPKPPQSKPNNNVTPRR